VLSLAALEVIQRFRKPGGDEFALFCNRMILASCWAGGVPRAEVSTSSRTDAKDKGVDTRVARAIGGDKSGYFDFPTIWQFKAADEANVSGPDMEKEVNKPRAKQWLEEGNAYRICICDHLTPDKKQTLLDALTIAVQAINNNAPDPMILSVDDIVDVVNSFPALVLDYRPGADGLCILFDRWRQLVTGITPTFVPPSGFDATRTVVLNHVDLGKDVRSPVLTLYGAAGAGKTRVAYECLREIPEASSLVLYTSSEDDAVELAQMLINRGDSHAIVIVDDCSLEARERLARVLMNFRDRIRCLCIDNSQERVSTVAPELIVQKLGILDLENVLKANFRGITPDRLRAYAQFCDGSVRLAADMCAHYDTEIAQARSIGPVLAKIDEYYRLRLKDESQREAVEAIAMIKRVRHKGESPTDLDVLCEFLGIDKKSVEKAIAQIKDAPGWIEKGALYYRATPDLIAMTAFNSGWLRWANDDAEGLLARMPPSIQESFMRRASESGSPEVREIVQRFFRRFADDFSSRDLVDIRLVDRFLNLVEIEPVLYLPALRRTIEGASSGDLTGGPEWTGGSWGPRRQLVWTAEKFAQFPEHFADCEAILFVLALNECEPRIGNNATKTWQELYRLLLSGTAIAFSERMALLRERLKNAQREQAGLFAGVLETVLNFMGSKIASPSVVAGKVAPPQWAPKTGLEFWESIENGLNLLNETTQHSIPEIANGAKKALIRDLEMLTRRGWIDKLRPIMRESHLDETDKASFVSVLKSFRQWGKHADGSEIKPEYDAKLSEWIEELRPTSFHARLVESVGEGASGHFGREKEWEQELDELARELFADRSIFNSEIEWLTSEGANGALEFGSRLGLLDASASLLPDILNASRNRAIAFIRGYVGGLVYGAKIDPTPINECLDRLETEDPLLACQIALAGGGRLSVFERSVREIRSSRISPYFLRNFTYWVGDQRVTEAQVVEALALLTPLAADDNGACDVLVDFLGARVHDGTIMSLTQRSPDLIWNAVTVAVGNPPVQSFWLTQALDKISTTNHLPAIRLACEALVGDNYQFAEEAESLLTTWASQYPDDVMNGIGALMLDENIGWRFFASKFGVFSAIPVDSVIRWLESAGAEGAQKIARHLAKPYVDASGTPVVPKLTEFVLTRFENDERVLNEFLAGSHSLQMYVGDIASQREAEADAVRPFLNHPLKRIREWARYEEESGLRDAVRHREREDEMNT
jgi:hypothetical protein